jgi:hypothetical protein
MQLQDKREMLIEIEQIRPLHEMRSEGTNCSLLTCLEYQRPLLLVTDYVDCYSSNSTALEPAESLSFGSLVISNYLLN